MRNKHDYKRPFCEICGKTGGWYTQDGWRTCEAHFETPKPELPAYDSVTGEFILPLRREERVLHQTVQADRK